MFTEAASKPVPSLDHDIVNRVAPSYHKWSNLYGKPFLYWFGSVPRLVISDPAMIKEVLMNTGKSFEKLSLNPLAKRVYGEGLVGLTGDEWAFHRRIANQAFKMERVKVEDNSLFLFQLN